MPRLEDAVAGAGIDGHRFGRDRHTPVEREAVLRLRGGRDVPRIRIRQTLIHDEVKYYDFASPPGSVWALPHLFAMHKHNGFQRQSEYRIAFGIRKNVFNLEHVDCFIVREGETFPILKLEAAHHRKTVRTGSLADCCRLM